MTGVGVYSYNTGNNEAAKIRNDILHIVKAHEWALQMHGFFVDFEEKTIRFDVVLSFDIMPEEALEILNKDLSAAYPEFSVHIAPDLDI